MGLAVRTDPDQKKRLSPVMRYLAYCGDGYPALHMNMTWLGVTDISGPAAVVMVRNSVGWEEWRSSQPRN